MLLEQRAGFGDGPGFQILEVSHVSLCSFLFKVPGSKFKVSEFILER
jgi:hypothetical protein